MKTYPNEDDITEQLGNMIKTLTTITFSERDGIVEKLQIMHDGLVEEYCDSVLSDDGFVILKKLIRVKLRLKKSQTNDESLTVISSSILTLRELIKKNEALFWLWVECDQRLHMMKSFFPLVMAITLTLIVVGVVWVGGGFSPA
ncbi:Uncharacterised protein [Serratia fonticola]|uniref:hypothetical protein n=1 Tax=Serratia fonticola TaxID=47917 RepID=UPI00217CAB08|nr:hypothetical protein [Serratia fonticola]CAI2031066.1 Uncharacterised protein [Serratia fonticola]